LSTDAKKLKLIQQNFAALRFNGFFLQVQCTCALEQLKVHTLRQRKNRLLALFLIQVSLGAKSILIFWKLFILEFLLDISETFLYVVSALQVKTVILMGDAVCSDADVLEAKLFIQSYLLMAFS
jgi:hypothetical protein